MQFVVMYTQDRHDQIHAPCMLLIMVAIASYS